METFICPECGETHDLSQLALVYRVPRHVARLSREISRDELMTRVRITDDLCVIDEEQFFIRGVLEVPIQDLHSNFEWGLWALVRQEDFLRYIELWDADIEEDEPPFQGWLSGSPPEYPEAEMTEITIHLRSNGLRPLFRVIAAQQPLAIDQRAGITFAKVHQFIANLP